MKEAISLLNKFKLDLEAWIENPTVSANPEVMKKILDAVELSIVLINTNGKVASDDRDMFEGSTYLARYFDGWGEPFFDQYIKMINYIKKNHY